MAEVRLCHVEKTYANGFKAVHGISLTIHEGEFMVLVGPSGCAKSTTLRMVAGLEEISCGDVYIGQQRVNGLPPKDRGISMVFQNYALYPHMTVYDNMAFGLRQQRLPNHEIDRRIQEVAETLEITPLLNNKPNEMSGGQRQRVALGRAIVRKPDVFLFDEPLSNLDAKLRVSTRVSIAQLHQDLKNEGQPATMIYVTHDQVEAMTLGDRICVLNQGKIMQVDTPMNLYLHPANKFVAGFIGSPSMNLMKVQLQDIEGKVCAVTSSEHRWVLPPDKQVLARAYLGKWVWFGLRPEHVQLSPSPKGDNVQIHRLNVVESMGNELYLYFQMGDDQLVARVPFEPKVKVYAGELSALYFDTAHCHLFDIETECSLIDERLVAQVEVMDTQT
ncbi:ABC transporter ATP-binding protein [Vibrio nigripulchritudo]|uniref:ABC transporter ATP-binding protein n=1 Tax=Vibrio nigripulchritudo TaxID=28173 RepID=UPI0003B1BB07|nr:sn-glycerol-3-phosphate ABC transporter ATP-binding protein UgpC [Vibrio nigripulchritudo]CCN85987.1 ABC transporter, ATP-binding component [Vibrio nigripulchritudo BLFn1]CCN97785.1 ABC transporter, ATP-binding component [Vibrio nigripulchritudo ENn2]CCO56096.1 ABC transporter, ATP-binding component [Vibrio nigripulchritudo Wn13]